MLLTFPASSSKGIFHQPDSSACWSLTEEVRFPAGEKDKILSSYHESIKTPDFHKAYSSDGEYFRHKTR